MRRCRAPVEAALVDPEPLVRKKKAKKRTDLVDKMNGSGRLQAVLFLQWKRHATGTDPKRLNGRNKRNERKAYGKELQKPNREESLTAKLKKPKEKTKGGRNRHTL